MSAASSASGNRGRIVAEKTLRTWCETRCDECCNGDRCDDPTHFERQFCPHCKGTGFALWLAGGREDARRRGCAKEADEYEARTEPEGGK